MGSVFFPIVGSRSECISQDQTRQAIYRGDGSDRGFIDGTTLRENQMPQWLAKLWSHLVFSTKERRAYLQNAEIRNEMFHMLSHKINEIGCTAEQSGGWVDHLHILFGLSSNFRVCDVVEHVKTEFVPRPLA